METPSPALARGTRGGAGDLKRGLFVIIRIRGGRARGEVGGGDGGGVRTRGKVPEVERREEGVLCFRNRGRS